jgi:hypothetical protein
LKEVLFCYDKLMNRKLYLTNPRYPYFALLILLLLFGGIYTKELLSSGNLGRALKIMDYLYATICAAVTILLSLRITYLYLLPEYSWKRWAAQHNGRYSAPPNLLLHPYGMVIDMLEGKTEQTNSPFVLMRSVQAVSNWPYTSRFNFFVRRWIVLAEPATNFSVNSIDDANLKILSAKRYYYNKPTYQGMLSPVK